MPTGVRRHHNRKETNVSVLLLIELTGKFSNLSIAIDFA